MTEWAGVRSGPVRPPEHLDSDEKLLAAGWAAGFGAGVEMFDVYAETVRSGDVANAQWWSLWRAIKAHVITGEQEKLRALAALMDYIGDGEDNVIRNIRDFANGEGDDDNDPRVQARRWGLEF